MVIWNANNLLLLLANGRLVEANLRTKDVPRIGETVDLGRPRMDISLHGKAIRVRGIVRRTPRADAVAIAMRKHR